MSASQQKKLRKEQQAEGLEQLTPLELQEAASKKRSKVLITITCIILAVLIVVAAVFNSNLFYNKVAAAEINGKTYSAAEVNYYYWTNYYTFCNTYGSYLSYMGLDTSLPLGDQQYSEDMTWEDYFKEQAKTTMIQIQSICEEAKEAGFELDEDALHEIEHSIEDLDATAESAGFASVKQYLTAGYGKGMTEEIMRECLTDVYTANLYYQEIYESFTYTDEELEEYYTENADSFDYIDYSYYLVSAEADEEGNVSEDAMAAAKATADSIIAGVDSVETFENHVAASGEDVSATTTTTAGASLNTNFAEWLLDDSRTAGDCTVIEVENSGCYVVYFSGRNNNHYPTVDVRHILINAEANEDGEYTDEAKAEAKAKAEDLLAEWEAGDATEDSFAALANEHSEDSGSNTNGGLYETVYEGQMVEEFNDFCFADGRTAGDTGIVYGTNGYYAGYHIIYFVGQSDVLYSSYIAENELRNEELNAWNAEKMESYTYTKKMADKYVG